MSSAEREFWRSPTCTVWISHGDDGVLRFSGYDRAHLGGYEYTVAVQPFSFSALRRVLGVDADTDLVDALCGAVEQIMAVGERRWLQSHGIPADLQTW